MLFLPQLHKIIVLPIWLYMCHCKICAEKATFSALRFLGTESHENKFDDLR